MPDFVWNCGSNEVMEYVEKLLTDVADLKKSQTSSTKVSAKLDTSIAEEFEACPDRALAFVGAIGEADSHQIQPLLTLLKGHLDNVQVCSEVCKAVENLTFTDTENRQTIVQHGGIEAILAAMDRHADEGETLQRPAMDALWNLTFDDDAVDHVTDTGLEQIIKSMRQHPDVPELQGSACAVFLNLAVREHNRTKIIQHGCLELMVSAMQGHAQNEDVLEQGCQALYMLAYHQNLRPFVVAAKGHTAAALAASLKTGSGGAQKWGRWLEEVLQA